MFDNIGGKIKGLAKFICWAGIILSVIAGIAIGIQGFNNFGYYYNSRSNDAQVLSGIIVAVVGSLLSWVGSFVLYGFGQLVDNSDTLVHLKRKETGESYTQSQTVKSKPYVGESFPSGKTLGSTVGQGTWTCPTCFAKNGQDNKTCKSCGTPKP